MHQRQYFTLTILATVLLALSACSGAGGSGLLTLEDIPGGFEGPTVITLTDTSATISVDTGVPTVCNAPFGETTEYGEVATIPMLGGATLDHALTFSGLEPDTTYHYLVTLTDINGNVYQSGDFTFTTTAAEAASGPTNWLSLGAGASVSEVSSNFGGGANGDQFGADSAIDDNGGTAWSSGGDGDNAFIVIDMVGPVAIDTLVVHTRTMTNDTAQIFAFTVTDDNGEVFGPFELPDAEQSYEFPVEIVSSMLRFDAVDSNGGNTGFVDLVAYGALVEE